MTTVKSHIRKTKSGKVANVKQHNRDQQAADQAKRDAHRAELKAITDKVFGSVSNNQKASAIVHKYKDRPMNMKLMVDSKWKTIKINVSRNKEGKIEVKPTPIKVWDISEQEWNKFIKENSPLVNRIINRVNFKSEIIDDLKQVGNKALFDAANSYIDKYNPTDPPDIMKYLSSAIAGSVRDEVARQTMARFSLPYNKRVLYNKFTKLFEEYNGDYDKIHEAMQIKRKDLYPSNSETGDILLEKEGYVTDQKLTTVQRATELYEDAVNRIEDTYQKDLDQLELRSTGDRADYNTYKLGLETYDSEIKTLSGMVQKEQDKERRANLQNKIQKKNEEKKRFEVNFKPVSKEDKEFELGYIENKRQESLRKAKQLYDVATNRTKIQGTYELFRMFEGIMSIKDIDLSSDVVGEEGEKVPMEQMVGSPDEVSALEKIVIKEEFKRNLNELERGLDLLEPFTRDVMRLRLGLHEKNKLYKHGLWGEPMSIKEIIEALGDDAFKTTEGSEYKDALKKWQESKPSNKIKVKRSPKEYNKEVIDFDKRVQIVRSAMDEFNQSESNLQKRAAMREKLKSRLRVRKEDRPTKFIEREATAQEMIRLEEKWNKAKPKATNESASFRYDKIANELSWGRFLLRRMFKGDNTFVNRMIDSYQAMRRYGLSKATLTNDLKKSLYFDSMFGYEYVKKEHEDMGMVMKIFKKVKEYLWG